MTKEVGIVEIVEIGVEDGVDVGFGLSRDKIETLVPSKGKGIVYFSMWIIRGTLLLFNVV